MDVSSQRKGKAKKTHSAAVDKIKQRLQASSSSSSSSSSSEESEDEYETRERVAADMKRREYADRDRQRAPPPPPTAPVQQQMVQAQAPVQAAAEPLSLDLVLRSMLEVTTRAQEQHVAQMADVRAMMQSIAVQGDQRLQQMQSVITSRLEQTEQRSEQRAQQLEQRLAAVEQNLGSSVATTSTAVAHGPSLHLVAHEPKTRMLIEFLVRFGMNTRTGIIAAFPVLVESTLRIVICVPLLKIGLMALFNKKASGCSMTVQNRYYNFLFSAMQQFLVEVDRDEVTNAIMPVFPMRFYNDGRANMKDWLVVDVDFFLSAVDYVSRHSVPTLREPEVPVDQLEWKMGRGKSMPMWDASSRHQPSSSNCNKLAWGCETVREALDTPAVRQYLAKLGHTAGVCHFSGVTPQPTAFVRDLRHFALPGSPMARAAELSSANANKRARAKRAPRSRRGAAAAAAAASSEEEEEEEQEEESENDHVKRARANSASEQEGDEIVA